jgi:hypothetical protein
LETKEKKRPQSHFSPLSPYTVVNGSDSLSLVCKEQEQQEQQKQEETKRFNFPQLAWTFSNKIAKPAGQFALGSGYFL